MKVLKCNDNAQYFIISYFYELNHVFTYKEPRGWAKKLHMCVETCGGTLASLNFPKMAKGKKQY